MTEEIINEMYLLAVKSKLQRGAITVENRLAYIIGELNLHTGAVPPDVEIPVTSNPSIIEPIPEPIVKEDKTSLEKLEIVCNKYAQQPEDDGFLNRELELDKNSMHIYEIHITNNPSIAYYELITDGSLCAEYLRSPSLVPSNVVVFDTVAQNSDSKLMKVKDGRLEKSGKIWKIVEPCHMKWC